MHKMHTFLCKFTNTHTHIKKFTGHDTLVKQMKPGENPEAIQSRTQTKQQHLNDVMQNQRKDSSEKGATRTL